MLNADDEQHLLGLQINQANRNYLATGRAIQTENSPESSKHNKFIFYSSVNDFKLATFHHHK